jgi:hypothetical protein
MDVTFDNLSRGVWNEQEARGYLELLLRAIAHAKQVRAMFMDVLLTHDEQRDEYDALASFIEAVLAKREVTPRDLREVYAKSVHQPNLENSLVTFGRFGSLVPQPGWEASFLEGRERKAGSKRG